MERSQTSLKRKMESGEYLPLSVWGAKGWPVETIEEKCSDYIMHPQLNIKLYRVVTLTVSTGQEEKVRVGEKLRASCPSSSVLAMVETASAQNPALPTVASSSALSLCSTSSSVASSSGC